tara:strand:+ start:1855 stop:3309 length:1455 start_codon:yes stop_codon:yes gene_type:complete
MAIIYTYPRLNTVNNGDLLLISAVNTTRKPTMRVRVEDVKSYMNTCPTITDCVGSTGNLNEVLTADGTGGVIWSPASGGGGTGTVTSVGIAADNGPGTGITTTGTFTFTGGTNVTTNVVGNNVTINATGGAAGVSSITTATGVSTGDPISPLAAATGAVTLTSNAYAGTTNVGYVPTGGSATTFLRGDGTWVTPGGGGGGTTYSSTINYQTGNPTAGNDQYWINFYIENKTVGSPDFGATTTSTDVYFKRQSAAVGTQGGLPFNLFYNQYTPALDPGYDAGLGCSANTCLRFLMEESVADINTLNSGSSALGTSFAIFTQDMASLNSYRAPLRMNIDGGGVSPGNGTLGIRLIYGGNSAPGAGDDTALPSTVSVYYRDTTDTSSKVGGPAFNLVWAGADTLFAQNQNGGLAYTAGTDFVFSGNASTTVTYRYELFFQDEINAYNRCSYLKVTDGRVVFEDLPTADPVSKGVLWNDAGDLKISLG